MIPLIPEALICYPTYRKRHFFSSLHLGKLKIGLHIPTLPLDLDLFLRHTSTIKMPTTISPLATFTPSCNSRTWLSTPHPHLPILATACSDKTVRIYSLKNFTQESLVSGGHKRSIRSCAWKGDSGVKGESVLATGSFDASVGVWVREENERKERVGDEMDFTGGMAGGSDGEEEEEEWRLDVILDGHDSEIKSLAFCPTAPLLATCSRDKSVWIWEELDGDNFETVAVLQDHEGDVKTVAWHPEEQLLASGSYDEKVRLWRDDGDDWACCARIAGHEGTVWGVEFEPTERVGLVCGGELSGEESEERKKSGSRLMTCSDDKTIRIWRKRPREKTQVEMQGRAVPSIWKRGDFEEDWYQEAILPQIHERPIYAANWSKKTGRVVSTGSDGQIVVYEEQLRKDGDVEMSNGDASKSKSPTEWVVIATYENGHDVFEINHAVWAPRCDKEKRFEGEEIIVTTGDDGDVKAWVVED